MMRAAGCWLVLLKALFGVGFVLFLLVGVLESVKNSEAETLSKVSKPESLKFVEENNEEKKVVVGPNYSNFINYSMSKRRVPNGHDPIHNRKAGNSGRPPGEKRSR